MARVSIVIPNYTGAEHLPLCLDSIRRQTEPEIEVIVVDNGSTDASLAVLKEWEPMVRVIRFRENRGFAAAVNAGILASDRPYVALLNNDIELDPQWTQELVRRLEERADLSATASKMLNFFDRTLIDAAGDVLTVAGNVIGRGTGEKDGPTFSAVRDVFGACAGAGMYRRAALDDIGLFDESFFAWFEDADHSFRSQSRGWKCEYVPTAVCYHKRGATARKMSDFAMRLHMRNHLYFQFINLPLMLIVLRFPFLFVSRLRNWSRIIADGGARAFVWGWREFFAHLPELWTKRRAAQRNRRVNVQQLLRSMER